MASHLEARMRLILLSTRIKGIEAEFRFHPERMWRFDFAIPDQKIAIEVEGGVWTGGRHTSGAGFTKDCEKYNAAAVMGWRVLRYTAKTLTQVTKDLPVMINPACQD